MLKWISPLAERLRQIPRPRMFSVTGHAEPDPEHPTAGQRLAERVAAFVGSWAFLGGQAGFLVLWLIYNTLQFTTHFDPPPYILLNLLLSFQAAFTGPVLLIAANVGAIRDHAQASRIEKLSAQNEELAEQNRKLVEQMCGLEEMVDQHITASARAHSAEIAELATLLRAIHATVTAQQANGNGAAPIPALVSDAPVAASATTPVPQEHSQPQQPQNLQSVSGAANNRTPQPSRPKRRR